LEEDATAFKKIIYCKTPKGSEDNSQGWSEAESLGHRQPGAPALKGRNRSRFIAPFSGLEMSGRLSRDSASLHPWLLSSDPFGVLCEHTFLEWYSCQMLDASLTSIQHLTADLGVARVITTPQ
jgi:hypothetical protein